MSYSRNLAADLVWNEQSQSYVRTSSKIYTSHVELHDNTYYACPTIVNVDLMNTPWVNNSMFGAFENCSNLQSVTNINSNVTNMQAAFMNCSKLAAAPTLPPSITTMNSIFYGCSNLTTMPTIPGNVTDMSYSFMYCNNMSTTTTIPNSVNDVCYAFTYTNINTSPVLPPNLTELNYTFAFCKNLNDTPTIPSNVQTLLGTFQGCQKIQSAPTIPNSVYDLSYTFSGCYNLRTAPEISNNVLYIDETFKDCYNLTGDIIIRTPNIVHNVTAINTFDNTSLRKNVYIPPYYYNDTTTHSETYNAFIEAGYDDKGTKDGVYLCYNYYPALPSDWETTTAANSTIILEKYIGVNTTVVTPHNDWYSNKILNTSTTTTGPFVNNKNIENVDLAEIEVIGNNFSCTFCNCDNLKSVSNINQNGTNAYRMFFNCYSLESANVTVPNTTNIDYLFYICRNLTDLNLITGNITSLRDTFYDCNALTNLSFTIPNSVTTMRDTFWNCRSLQTFPTIPDSVTELVCTFGYCFGLTTATAPAIPASVTNMYQTYASCWNLTEALPLPPNVTNIAGIFASCANIANASITIPNSVVDMARSFSYCMKITSAPNIPNQVTNMWKTLEGCRNLTGDIYVKSNQITNATECFATTSLTKNVYIPFEYENGVATQTYNAFINAGYGTDEYLHGVHLKDIDGSKITINPTPADATVLMYNETTGTEIDEDVLNKFSYTNVDGNIEIQALNTTDTAIVVPSMWTETKGMRAIDGSKVYYKVSKDGYNTIEGEITVDGSETINVNLEQIMCTFTVVPVPSDATVTLTTSVSDGEITHYAWYCSGIGQWLYNTDDDYAYTLTDTPTRPDDIYAYRNNVLVKVDTVYAYDDNGIIPQQDMDEIDGWVLERDSTKDITYPQSGNSITVPWGTEVSYTVSKDHYTTVTGTEIVKTTGNKYIPLVIDKYTFTINPTPADAAVQILVNGRLANASASDWVFTADNLNSDIELQEYTGSNTAVVIPTSYETINTVTADYGSTIEWKVSKDGYKTQSDTFTLTEDLTLPVTLSEITYGVDVSDYEYTFANEIVTLTKYTGNGGDIDTPKIEEG